MDALHRPEQGKSDWLHSPDPPPHISLASLPLMSPLLLLRLSCPCHCYFCKSKTFTEFLSLFSMTLHIIIGKGVNSTVSFSKCNMRFEAHSVWSHPAGTISSLGTGKRSWEEPGDQARKVPGSEESSSLGDLENLAWGPHHAWCGTEGADLNASSPAAKT